MVTIDDQPWFVATDSLLGMGYPTTSNSMIIKKLDKCEVILKQIEEGVRSVNLISESGLYKLIMRSDKPQAKPFQDWVTKVVLPRYKQKPKLGMPVVDPIINPIVPAVGRSNPVKTMSSLEIAELTGKAHNDVLKDIRRILAAGDIDEGRFSSIYRDGMNREKLCYNLPRLECDLVITGYSIPYRVAILRRWQELEATVAEQQAPAKQLSVAEMTLMVLTNLQEQVSQLSLERDQAVYSLPISLY